MNINLSSRVPLFALVGSCLALSSILAAAGHAQMNAYFQSDFTDMVYQKTATEKVMKTWGMPPAMPAAGKKTVVQSAIGPDGKLVNAVVTMSSGLKRWDDAALTAVKKAAPFSPLPASYKGNAVQVHWHFSVVP